MPAADAGPVRRRARRPTARPGRPPGRRPPRARAATRPRPAPYGGPDGQPPYGPAPYAPYAAGPYPPGGATRPGGTRRAPIPRAPTRPAAYPPAAYPPGAHPPGGYPPGAYQPGAYPPGPTSRAAGALVPGAAGPGLAGGGRRRRPGRADVRAAGRAPASATEPARALAAQRPTVTRVAVARSRELTGAAVRRVRAASRADGAAESGLTQLLWANALHAAGDAMIAVSLAGTLFFAATADAQRSNVALYLLVTMAPFAVVAPVIGPLLDRMQRGRRWAMGGASLGRAVLALVMAAHYDDLFLYPAALGVLVLSKAHNVLRAAVAAAGAARGDVPDQRERADVGLRAAHLRGLRCGSPPAWPGRSASRPSCGPPRSSSSSPGCWPSGCPRTSTSRWRAAGRRPHHHPAGHRRQAPAPGEPARRRSAAGQLGAARAGRLPHHLLGVPGPGHRRRVGGNPGAGRHRRGRRRGQRAGHRGRVAAAQRQPRQDGADLRRRRRRHHRGGRGLLQPLDGRRRGRGLGRSPTRWARCRSTRSSSARCRTPCGRRRSPGRRPCCSWPGSWAGPSASRCRPSAGWASPSRPPCSCSPSASSCAAGTGRGGPRRPSSGPQ